MIDQNALKAAQKWLEDSCHRDCDTAARNDIESLAAVILRERAAAVETSTPGIERRARIKALEGLDKSRVWLTNTYGVAGSEIEFALCRLAKEEKDHGTD